MNTTDDNRLPLSALILALSSGVFSCLGIATVLTVLGVSALEAYVFAALGGFTISCFVWIERSLISQVKEKEQLLGVEVARRLDWQNKLFAFARLLRAVRRGHIDHRPSQPRVYQALADADRHFAPGAKTRGGAGR